LPAAVNGEFAEILTPTDVVALLKLLVYVKPNKYDTLGLNIIDKLVHKNDNRHEYLKCDYSEIVLLLKLLFKNDDNNVFNTDGSFKIKELNLHV
jgi:hypothetical protein